MKCLFLLPTIRLRMIRWVTKGKHFDIYPFKIFCEVLVKMSLFPFRSKTETKQPKHCYTNNRKQP